MPPVANTRMPARCDRRGQVAAARLQHAIASDVDVGQGQFLQLRTVEADGRNAAEHGEGRGDGAFLPHRLLGRPGRLQVQGPRQAVGDERRFQGHHRLALPQRRRHLRAHVNDFGRHRHLAPARAA
jgi:hypothetical protein